MEPVLNTPDDAMLFVAVAARAITSMEPVLNTPDDGRAAFSRSERVLHFNGAGVEHTG